MIKDFFSLVSYIFKTTFTILKYISKGVIWYVKTLTTIFDYQKEKTNKKCHIKGEIL
jgi:hypothetical protein